MRKLLVGVVDTGTDKVENYVRALAEMGADVHVLGWAGGRDAASDVAAYDALVLCGGDDVAAHYFGEEGHPAVTLDPPERDHYELELARLAVQADRPLLAVCRGMQVLNVALGGAVDQHIPDTAGRLEHRGGVLHLVEVAADSLLAGLLPADARTVWVNSFHHQGAGRLAPALRLTACTTDGVPEAIEGPGRFCLGVQWHPERPEGDAALRSPVFGALLEAAARACAESARRDPRKAGTSGPARSS